MQKIMFNDHFGLQRATLHRVKTMTRRILKVGYDDWNDVRAALEDEVNIAANKEAVMRKYAKYQVGEVVAIAQTYKEILESEYLPSSKEDEVIRLVEANHIGITNKMYVSADLMPHHIQITGRKLERLQDISDEDCLAEGIIRRDDLINSNMEKIVRYTFEGSFENHIWKSYATPREAFAVLIDRTSGRGTWSSNPWVVAYSYELKD